MGGLVPRFNGISADFSPRKHLLNRGGEAWILRMPAVNLCNSNLLNSFISNSLNLTQNPMRAMILQKNCPIFSNHVTFDSATHVVMCSESMARQSRTVPSAQEIRAKYSLVDACFILRRCYIYISIYLYLLWRNTLTHLWSGGSEWNTLAHECAQTLGSLWFFGHQEPSQRHGGHWIGLLTRMLRKLEGMMLVLSMAHLRPVACSLRT